MGTMRNELNRLKRALVAARRGWRGDIERLEAANDHLRRENKYLSRKLSTAIGFFETGPDYRDKGMFCMAKVAVSRYEMARLKNAAEGRALADAIAGRLSAQIDAELSKARR